MSTFDKKPLAAILLSIATMVMGYVAAAPFLDLAVDALLPTEDPDGVIPSNLADLIRHLASFDSVQAATDFYVVAFGTREGVLLAFTLRHHHRHL